MRALVLAAIVCIPVVVSAQEIGVGASPVGALADSQRTLPVFLVRGFDPTDLQAGDDVSSTWGKAGDSEPGRLVPTLIRYGWPSLDAFFIQWGWYECDSGTPWYLDDFGQHASGNVQYGQASNHAGGGCTPGHNHNRDTAIEHLGYHLAWGIHHFTKNGGCIVAVGYSMGGLIIRDALYRIQRGESAYPPASEICVRSVVTMGTPHGGTGTSTNIGCDNIGVIGKTRQCLQQQPGSNFLTTLANSPIGRNPQMSGGTNWVLMGSPDDHVAPYDSATGGQMTPLRKVRLAGIEHSAGVFSLNPNTWVSGPDSYSDALSRTSSWTDDTGTHEVSGTGWVGHWVDRSLVYGRWGCGSAGDSLSAWPLQLGSAETGETYISSPIYCHYKQTVGPGVSRLVVELDSPGQEQRNLRVSSGSVTCSQATQSVREVCNIRNPQASEWSIRVENPGGTQAPFAVTPRAFVEDDCGIGSDARDIFASAEFLATPKACTGAFYANAYDDRDWYQFDLVPKAAINVSLLQSPGSDFEICLYSPWEELLGCGGASDEIGYYREFESGRYRVEVKRISGYGTYSLALDVTGLRGAEFFGARNHVPPGATFDVCFRVNGYDGARIDHAGIHYGTSTATTTHGYTWTNTEVFGDSTAFCDQVTAPPVNGAVLYFRAHAVGPHEGVISDLTSVIVADTWDIRADDATQEANVMLTEGGNGGNSADLARKRLPVQAVDLDWAMHAKFKMLGQAVSCWPMETSLDFRVGRMIGTSQLLKHTAQLSTCALWTETSYSWAEVNVPLSALTGDSVNFFEVNQHYFDLGSDYTRLALDTTPKVGDQSDIRKGWNDVEGEWMGYLTVYYPDVLSAAAEVGRVEGSEDAARPPEGKAAAANYAWDVSHDPPRLVETA